MTSNTLEYFKLREWAKAPIRANPSDAGIDVFYCPVDSDEPVYVGPQMGVLLGIGIKFGIPHGYYLEVKNRSSVASKKQLVVGACVCDSGYNNEIFINLINVGNKPQHIAPGDKIAQLVMLPVKTLQLIESKYDDLYSRTFTISNRGLGGFGSTGS